VTLSVELPLATACCVMASLVAQRKESMVALPEPDARVPVTTVLRCET